ncbi:aminotransferase class III-fold pyridoxal phosphate-dependent enzyme [Herbaspirillum camelliae]|uniref:aminotransferase class III-fold pyridoxal phosphate-dependent enzyme n=1 Tax=Herbaspirillum camelliae TaxID=1892903 RepID=UPI000949C799|nr:aminotransferase class III-fold pyridoxal phosphate-dependent enzyme [Herbaspirillum camelliae]
MNHFIGHALARPGEDRHTLPAAFFRILSQATGCAIVRGAGMQVWDEHGACLLDGVCGLYGNTLGHDHAALAAARQMSAATADPLAAQLTLNAALSSHLTTDGARVLSASSHELAWQAMLRTVRQYWTAVGQPDRRLIITCHDGEAGPQGPGRDHRRAPDSSLRIAAPDWFGHDGYLNQYEFGLAAARTLEQRILELGPEHIAAFVAEPFTGASGLLHPPYSYWPEIQRICTRHHVLLCIDEGIGGCGRTGQWFAHTQLRFSPDIVLLAQGLTSALAPLAALVLSPQIMDALAAIEGALPVDGRIDQADPTATAIALANLRALDEGGLTRQVEHGTGLYLQHCLRERFDNHPLVGDIQGNGMLAALQLSPDPARRARFADEAAAGIDCARQALAQGVLVQAAAARILLAPPMIATHADIDGLVERLGAAVDASARRML